jgi:hypothetical protein
MAEFKFPKNPHAAQANPFDDGEGSNPFGGDAEERTNDFDGTSPHGQNPYQTSTSSSIQPYHPGDYETFLPNRGPLVWWLGLVGLGIQLLAVAIAVIAVVSIGDFLEGIAFGLPGQLIGIAISLPAWIIGQSDSRAIAAGAMEEGSRRATHWGLFLGRIGTVLGACQLVFYFGLLFYDGLFG